MVEQLVKKLASRRLKIGGRGTTVVGTQIADISSHSEKKYQAQFHIPVDTVHRHWQGPAAAE
jgi:hypothetical protein